MAFTSDHCLKANHDRCWDCPCFCHGRPKVSKPRKPKRTSRKLVSRAPRKKTVSTGRPGRPLGSSTLPVLVAGEVETRLLAGMTIAETAHLCETSRDKVRTIRRHLTHTGHNIVTRPQQRPGSTLALEVQRRVEELLLMGASISATARFCAISRDKVRTIRNGLVRAGQLNPT